MAKGYREFREKNQNRTFQEGIDHDLEMMQAIRDRPGKESNGDKRALEQKSVDTLDRIQTAFVLMSGKPKEPGQPNLPVASHMLREQIEFKIPMAKPYDKNTKKNGNEHANEFVNWILYGVKDGNISPEDVRNLYYDGNNKPSTIGGVEQEDIKGGIKNLGSDIKSGFKNAINEVKDVGRSIQQLVNPESVEKSGMHIFRRGVSDGKGKCIFGMRIGAGPHGEVGREENYVSFEYTPPTETKEGSLKVRMHATPPYSVKDKVKNLVNGTSTQNRFGKKNADEKVNCTGGTTSQQFYDQLEYEKKICEKQGEKHPFSHLKRPDSKKGLSVTVDPSKINDLNVPKAEIDNDNPQNNKTISHYIPGMVKVKEDRGVDFSLYKKPEEDVYQDLYEDLEDPKKKKEAFNVECNTLSNNEAIAKQQKIVSDLKEKVESRVPSTPSKVRVGGAAAAGFIFGLIVGGPIAAFALAAAAVLISYAPQIKEAICNKLEDRKLAKAQKKLEKLEGKEEELQGKRQELGLEEEPGKVKKNGISKKLEEKATTLTPRVPKTKKVDGLESEEETIDMSTHKNGNTRW